MLTERWYRGTPGEQMKGMVVWNTAPLGNHYVTYPPGTRFTIMHKYSGLDLRSDPCECCEIQAKISKVSPTVLCEEQEAIRRGYITPKHNCEDGIANHRIRMARAVECMDCGRIHVVDPETQTFPTLGDRSAVAASMPQK